MAYDVIVVGGGAAGMFSAGTAARCGLRVLLLEQNRDLGKKLRITGKGRCNVLNDCTPEDVLKNVPTGSRFLYSSVWGFPPEAAKAFFEEIGVPLKTERGSRVFPVSDKAGDVVAALEGWMRQQGVTVVRGRAAKLILKDGAVRGVTTNAGNFEAPQVILATGGMSYPGTGSTGDGLRMAQQVGHTVTEISGSLVPLEVEGGCRPMAGLSLRNTGVTLWGQKKKPIYRDFGELLFMNYGLSGPTILSSSAHMDEKTGPYTIELDLKPALDDGKLDARLLRDFEDRKNQRIYEGLRGLLPAQLIPLILDRCEIPTATLVHDITREQRRRILWEIKHLRFSVVGKRPVDEAIITHGGVKLSEVNPTTMESKLVPGLYFAGEILDCDAYTGGFNLQIAWSTAYAAGTSCGNLENTVL
jgi:hypothetical protein